MEQELKILHREVFRAGSVILREGQPGVRAFVIESGKVEIWREDDGPRSRLRGYVWEGAEPGTVPLPGTTNDYTDDCFAHRRVPVTLAAWSSQ